MRTLREVLRLKFDGDLSDRQIAQSTHVSRSTIRDDLRRFAVSGLSWPLPAELGDADIDARRFPPKPALPDALRPAPDWALVNRELRRTGVTVFLLWQEYKAGQPDGFLYSWFCENYREWTGRLDAVMRQEHLAGEQCFVDYCGQTMPVIDRHTGEIRQAQIFVGVMGASNDTYAEATWSQTLPDWMGSHIRMLEYFGAAPALLIPDNLKRGVSNACRYAPAINPSYHALATHDSLAVIPARSKKPRDKANAECGVLVVSRWGLACLRDRAFFSLAALNTAISELLTRLNQRPFKKLAGCRETVFRTVDYPVMRALPEGRHVFSEWKKVRMGLDYHVEIDARYYSAPHTLIGKQRDGNFREHVVAILSRGQRVSSHARLHGQGRQSSTQAEHMPTGHREMAEWTPPRIVNWAASVGLHTSKLIEALIKRKQHPPQAFRAAGGSIRLGKHYGNARVEAACRRAFRTNAISYSSVDSILKHRLDELPLPQDARQSSLPIVHDNVRGPDYVH